MNDVSQNVENNFAFAAAAEQLQHDLLIARIETFQENIELIRRIAERERLRRAVLIGHSADPMRPLDRIHDRPRRQIPIKNRDSHAAH